MINLFSTGLVEDVLKKYNKDKNSLVTIEEYQFIINDLDQTNVPNVSHNEREQPHFNEEERLVLCPDPKVVDFIRYK